MFCGSLCRNCFNFVCSVLFLCQLKKTVNLLEVVTQQVYAHFRRRAEYTSYSLLYIRAYSTVSISLIGGEVF